jgi:hypothetical protein
MAFRAMADAGNRELDLDSVRATFPGWRIGGAPGNWYAFRGGLAALDGPWSLLRRHLRADTLMALAEQLCLQEYLDSLSDQELAEVWQRVSLPKPSGQAAS